MANDTGPIIRTGIVLDPTGTKAGAAEAVTAIRSVGAAAERTQAKVTAAVTSSNTRLASGYEQFAARQAAMNRQLAEAYSAAAIQARAVASGMALTNQQAAQMATRVQAIVQAFGQSRFAEFGVEVGKIGSAAKLAMPELEAMAYAENATRAAAVELATGAAPTFLERLAGGAGHASVDMSYLRRELVSSAAVMTGTNPMLDRMAYTLASMTGGAGGGKLAIGLIAGVAAVGLLAKGYEWLTRDVREATKTLDEFTASNAAMAAQANSVREFKFATTGGVGLAGVDVPAASAAIAKLQAAIAAGETLAQHYAITHAGDPVRRITEISQALADETTDASAAHAELLKIASLNRDTGFARQALEVDQFATAIVAAREEMRRLVAEQQHAQALQADNAKKYGSGPVALLGSGPQDAAARLAGAQSGGQKGLDAVRQEQSAVQEATKAWDQWTTSVNGRYLAGVTFTDALQHHVGVAEQLLTATQRQIADDNRATAAVRAREEAERAAAAVRAQNVRDLNDELDAIQKAYTGGQALLENVDREVATRRRQTEALTATKAEQRALNEATIYANLLAEAEAKHLEVSTRALHEKAHALAAANQAYDDTKAKVDAVHAAEEKAANAQIETIKNLQREVQRDFSNAFDQIFTKGANVFQNLWDTIRNGFYKLVSDILAAKLMQKVGGAIVGLAVFPALASAQGGAAIAPTGIPGLSVPLAQPGLNPAVGAGAAAFAGAGLGYSTGNVGVGFLGGAASGFALGGAVGAVVGAVGGLVGGLLGGAEKAREAAERMKAAQKAFTNALDAMVATVNHDNLGVAIAQVTQQFDDLRAQAFQAYGPNMKSLFGFGGTGDAAAIAQLNALEAKRIQQLKDEAALTAKTTTESLQARLLAAQGQTAAAAALNLQVQQEKEYAALAATTNDAATLALLKQVQAAEKLKAAADGVASSFLNIEDGFRVSSDWFHAIAPTPSAPPAVRPVQPTTTNTSAGKTGITVNVTSVLDGKVIAKATVNHLQDEAAATFGDSTLWSQIQ